MSVIRHRMEPKIARRRTAVRSQNARTNRTKALVAVSGVAALAAVWWMFTGPAVAIRDVTIRGYARDDARVLAAYVQRAASRSTMLSLPTDEIRRELGRFAWVDQVHVQRDWPSSIIVSITQVHPAAVAIPAEGRLGLLSPSGRLLAGVPSSGIPQNLPTVGVTRLPKLLGDPLPETVERGSIATLAALRKVGGVHVRRLQVRDGGVTAVLDSGLSLRLGSPDELDAKILAIRTVLPRIPQAERVPGWYLDVRFPRFAAVGKARPVRATVAAPVALAGDAPSTATAGGGSTAPPAAASAPVAASQTAPTGQTVTTVPGATATTVAPPPPPPPIPILPTTAAPVPSTTTSASPPEPTATIDSGSRVSP